MQLSDFNFADLNRAGLKFDIPLPSGEKSGETLTVMGPDCDEAVEAARTFTAAYRRVQDDLLPLDDKCKAKNDWTEYNEQLNIRCEALTHALAVSLVVGWSFSDPFSPEAVDNLFRQYRGLATGVTAFHKDMRDKLYAK